MEMKIGNGKNGIICAYCGATKSEVSFIIGAKPDLCMIYGTGKIACPTCYVKAAAEGSKAVDDHVKEYNKRVRPVYVKKAVQ